MRTKPKAAALLLTADAEVLHRQARELRAAATPEELAAVESHPLFRHSDCSALETKSRTE